PTIQREHTGKLRQHPRTPRQTVLGVIPKLSHPRHPLDTAPKGVETHPGDGRLSIGDTSKTPLHIYTTRGFRIRPSFSRFSKEAKVSESASHRNIPLVISRMRNRISIIRNRVEPATAASCPVLARRPRCWPAESTHTRIHSFGCIGNFDTRNTTPRGQICRASLPGKNLSQV